MRASLLSLLALALGACGTPPRAPVIERAPSAAPAPARPVAPPAAAARPRIADERPEFYTVKRGDTLYGIALDHGMEYRELAAWNQISDPKLIRVGQVLRLRPPAEPVAALQPGAAQVRPITSAGPVESRPLADASGQRPASGSAAAAPSGAPGAARTEPASPAGAAGTTRTELASPAGAAGTTRTEPAPAGTPGSVKTEPRAYKLPYSEENLALMSRPGETVAPPKPESAPEARTPSDAQQSEPDEEKVDWGWPASGKVIAGFSDPSNKGIDIGGRTGEPVHASASGRVVYSGSGLRGYGKLVIIKHNRTFLSAYAHNSQVLVKEGQNVIKGQKIAEIGDSDTDSTKLHFEIRRLGKPVDPARYLPERR